MVFPGSEYDQDRGELFNNSLSKNWQDLGMYSLGLEANLDLYRPPPNSTFGLDTVALGETPAIGGPSLDSQVVANFMPTDYLVGMFGLGMQPTNFSDTESQTNFSSTESRPSFLTTMKNKSLIPSLS